MANEPQYREQYIDRRDGQQTGQTVALWLLVALVFLLNFQVMQLNGEVRQLQGDREPSTLSPTGPAPGASLTQPEAPDYQAELESIINKMDRMGAGIDNIDKNVGNIQSELRTGGAQPGPGMGYPGQ